MTKSNVHRPTEYTTETGNEGHVHCHPLEQTTRLRLFEEEITVPLSPTAKLHPRAYSVTDQQ